MIYNREEYEKILKLMCGEGCLKNPEKSWPVHDNSDYHEKWFDGRELIIFDECIAVAENVKGRLIKYQAFFSLCNIRQNRNSFFAIYVLPNINSNGDFKQVAGFNWEDREFHQHQKTFMHYNEVDYYDFKASMKNQDGTAIRPGSCSTLPEPVKRILLDIFSLDNIQKAVAKYFENSKYIWEHSTSKQLLKSSAILQEIRDLILKGFDEHSKKTFEETLLQLSNKFYSSATLIFVTNRPNVVRELRDVYKIRQHLDDFLEIKLLCNVLMETTKAAEKDRVDPLNLQFKQLMTAMDVIPKGSPEFRTINQYVQNGVAPRHGYSKIELLDLIKLERFGEKKRFKEVLGNRKLLWHGSQILHFSGILSQGLRIAPPEAEHDTKVVHTIDGLGKALPFKVKSDILQKLWLSVEKETGDAFGRGVYFADVISKSANYCKSDNIGYLLLCDVALGEMKEKTYGDGETLPDGFQSFKGVGVNSPDPKGDFVDQNGCVIPLGKIVKGNQPRSTNYLHFNEYVVFDLNQIWTRYIVRVQLVKNV